MNIRFTYALKRTLLYASSLALFACGDCGASTNNNNPPADMTPTCTPACADGQSCVDGTCVDEGTASGLVVTAPGARSCEILLEEQASKVLGATYTDGVQGAWRKKAPNVALAISQTSDADLYALDSVTMCVGSERIC